MIDEYIKNQILASLPKILQDWEKERVFPEPRNRWFRLAKLKLHGTHYLVSLIVGKDEEETWKMANELIEWHKTYVKDQKDDTKNKDYTVKKY